MAPRRLRVSRFPPVARSTSFSESEEEYPGSPKPGGVLKPAGVMFILLMLLANFAGHHYPFLWAPATWHTLLRAMISHDQVLNQLGRPDDDLREMRFRELTSIPAIPTDSAGLKSWPRPNTLQPRDTERRRQHSGGDGSTRRDSQDWRSVFVKNVDITLHDVPECEGVIPPEYHPFKADPEPITQLTDLLRPNQRVLVFLPRHGLGNSLRGYVSAYVYALLSGRRLVRLHAAEHAKVYDLLCDSFECGFDAIRWANESGSLPMEIYRKFHLLEPFYFLEKIKSLDVIRDTIKSDTPILASRKGTLWDPFWHRRKQIRECVYAAFKCTSLWCVHTRAMYALVGRGGPTAVLDSVISTVLTRHVPAESEATPRPLALLPHGKSAVFDVALHVRTRTLAIEKAVKKDSLLYNESECEDPPTQTGEQPPKFLRSCLWDCIGVILETLRANLKSAIVKEGAEEATELPGLTILLATDDAELRPKFVSRLQRHGTVFYSSGEILHTSKAGGSSTSRLPTMAEFFLMTKAHTVIEASSYISTFTYFSALVGNGTLSGIKMKNGGCKLRLEHKASLDD